MTTGEVPAIVVEPFLRVTVAPLWNPVPVIVNDRDVTVLSPANGLKLIIAGAMAGAFILNTFDLVIVVPSMFRIVRS